MYKDVAKADQERYGREGLPCRSWVFRKHCGRLVPGSNPERFVPTCDDCVVNGIAQRRSTDGGRTWVSVAGVLSEF